MAVLDSSAIIDILAKNDLGLKISNNYGPELTATTAISVNEVLIGLKGERKAGVIGLFEELEVLPFDKYAALKSVEIEQNLRDKGKAIEKSDIMIASICMIRGLSLITTDKGFKRIDDLDLCLVE